MDITNPSISPTELHLLFVLLDSSLPTGGFVSSSGLESYAKHGFLSTRSPAAGGGTTQRRLVKYAQEAVENYAMGTVGFVADAWRCLEGLDKGKGKEKDLEETLKMVIGLDDGYEAMTLNHVTKRSSTAQGIAMLTLLSKGFSVPGYMEAEEDEGDDESNSLANSSSKAKRELVDMFRRAIRKGETAGHMPICWGLLANASGLALDRTIHLHLFLHARSLLSSAVRLNLIGPYASAQLLLHPLRVVIEAAVRKGLGKTSGFLVSGEKVECVENRGPWEWEWADAENGPAMTWPLGELLMGRHDMQHTRIFNS